MQKNSELNNMFFGYFSSLLLDLDPEAFERSLFL